MCKYIYIGVFMNSMPIYMLYSYLYLNKNDETLINCIRYN